MTTAADRKALLRRYLKVDSPPPRSVRFVFPELRPLGYVVRQGDALMTFPGTPELFLMAAQTHKIGLDRRPAVLAVNPLVVMLMEFVALLTEVELLVFHRMADETLRITGLKLSHSGNTLAPFLYGSPKCLMLFYPGPLLVLKAESGEFIPMALKTNGPIDVDGAVHTSLLDLYTLMTGGAVEIGKIDGKMHPMPGCLIGPHIMASGTNRVILVTRTQVSGLLVSELGNIAN